MKNFKEFLVEEELSEGLGSFLAPFAMGMASMMPSSGVEKSEPMKPEVKSVVDVIKSKSFHNKVGYLGQPNLAVIQKGQHGFNNDITSYVIDVKAKKYLGKYVDSKDLAEKVIAGEKKGWKFNPATFRFSNGEQSVAPFDFRP